MGAHLRSDDGGLIGREQERAQVTALLADLSDGVRVLHIGAGPGMGKTAVLRFAAQEAARRDIPVLSTSWTPAERGLRHAALHILLHPLLPLADDLPPRQRATLDAAFGAGHAEPDPQDLARAALRLLETSAGPTLVCVDDLDRLDDASRDTIRAMAHLRGTAGVGIVVAERTAAAPWLPPDARTVVLRPLPAPAAREIVRRSGRATSPTEEELILAVARGNPLALTELSLSGKGLGEAAGLGMLPATSRLAEAYAEDLDALSESATRVLLTAALSISPVAGEILAASTHLAGSAQDAREGLDEAVAQGLATEEGRHVRFPEPLVRAAILHREPAARRMTVHAALRQSVTDPAQAAWHAAQYAAGADEDLARHLESLADGPWPGTDLLVALAALECAARVSPDPERRAARLLRAAELACHHGLGEQARRHARGIDPAELGDLGRAMLLWLHDLVPGNSPVGRERIDQLCSAARAVATGHPALAEKLLHAAAGRCWWQQADAAARQVVVRTLKDLRSAPWSARELATQALTDPLSISHVPLEPQDPPAPDERLFLGQAAHLTGDFERAAHFLQDAETAARADGRQGRLPSILSARALGEIWLGAEWRTAHAMATEAHAIGAGLAHDNYAARAVGAQGIIEALQGRHDKALERAAAIEEASRHLGQGQHLNLATLIRLLTASGTGRYAEAYTQLRSSFTELLTPYSFQQFWGLPFLVEAALPAGETDDARAVVEHIARSTRSGRAPLLRGILAYAGAVLAPDDEAETRYRDALDGDAGRWPLLNAMTHLGHGAWLRRRRRVVESRAPLAAAEALFRALGATSRAELAASELRAAGGTDAEPAQDTAARVLSPQQLTIARLAARGLTNRAIGEQLHLSARTVASHLYQIFPKLDVTSRAQLAARKDLE
ncbi:LuxR family transcriptional regulator [Streptomyces sp. VRA16 Mangrove soil]|uniref:helix-turn-helix transcriptional regulator n=1 Tax=Streptomyces sp. VRA16 Mangrove soil TaxID=2817434 RepID=UPI001A9E7EF3|nr:LuxR family transcriptional regulator [Streptomyces sp. VRA16 Mangrove soil]MBO1329875.1 AAA family ATPase [Streptomyces sp. VRA16 Mangrove soil]